MIRSQNAGLLRRQCSIKDLQMSNHTMIQYVRHNGSGKRKGAFVAVPTGGLTYGIGWSLCNETAGDKFDKDLAVNTASMRAMQGLDESKVPQSLVEELRGFRSRARRYYKDKVENTSEIAKVLNLIPARTA